MPYFDHNATTPLRPKARGAWLRAQDEAWANPASPHRAGTRVKLRLQAAREKLAGVLSVEADRIVFTGGATEGAEAAVRANAAALPADAAFAISPTEHPAVREAVERHVEARRRVSLPVSSAGVVSPAAVASALAAGARAVAVMAANNETGVLQPWAEIAGLVRAAGATLVCDATQWFGKLPADGFGAADWVLGSAHKFGGPKGVGFLLRPAEGQDLVLRPGGGQQRGHRGGTEDWPGVAALVAALGEAERGEVWQEQERLRWRGDFEAAVREAVPGVRILGEETERLWNTVTLLLPWGEGERWVTRLDRRGFETSTGAACSTNRRGPASGLAALGLTPEETRRVVRCSAGWATTPEEWRALAQAFAEVGPEVIPPAGTIVA
jgi:cysteine desulfurase